MNWTTAALAKLSRVFDDGDWIESKDQSEDGIRLVQTGNIGEGVFKDRRDKARFISEATFKRLNCSEVQPGDILISRLPDPVGRACVVPGTGDRMITAVDCTIVRPDDDKIDPSFLVYYTQTANYLRDVEHRCTGTTRRRISRKGLGQISIPLPPLEEQKRIVAVLDQAFAALARARALAEANLADADELLQTEMESAFSRLPQSEPIISRFRTATGGTPPKSDNQNYGCDIRFVKPPELLDAVVQQTADGLSESARSKARIAPAGSVLVSCIGNLGKIGLLDEEEAAFNQQINAILPSNDIALPQFVFWQCRSKPFRRELESRASGTTVSIVNKSQFNSIPFWVPSLEEQSAIVGYLNELEQRCACIRRSYTNELLDLADLRQSLLAKAFAGELT